MTATAHGITAGTELGTTAGIAVAAGMTAAIAGLTAMRVVEAMEKSKQGPPTATPQPFAPPTYAPPQRPGTPF